MIKTFHFNVEFNLKNEHLKNTCNIGTSESLCDVTPVETWSSEATGTLVPAYFVYNIWASNCLGGPVTFSKYCFIYVVYYVHETSTLHFSW